MSIHEKAFPQSASSREYHTGLTRLEYAAIHIHAGIIGGIFSDMKIIEVLAKSEGIDAEDRSVGIAKKLLEACEAERTKGEGK